MAYDQEMRPLSEAEIEAVSGGVLPPPGPSIYEQLMERFPGGEWVGNSFFPNGAPDGLP